MDRFGVNRKTERFNDMMRNDSYLNALRCKFGYALTCHKAQGGEWNEVYIKTNPTLMWKPTKSTYQWVYTALTRAKDYVHMVNDCNVT